MSEIHIPSDGSSFNPEFITQDPMALQHAILSMGADALDRWIEHAEGLEREIQAAPRYHGKMSHDLAGLLLMMQTLIPLLKQARDIARGIFSEGEG